MPDGTAHITILNDGIFAPTRLLAHGFEGDEVTMRSIMEVDVTLNAAGQVAWLQRLYRGD